MRRRIWCRRPDACEEQEMLSRLKKHLQSRGTGTILVKAHHSRPILLILPCSEKRLYSSNKLIHHQKCARTKYSKKRHESSVSGSLASSDLAHLKCDWQAWESHLRCAALARGPRCCHSFDAPQGKNVTAPFNLQDIDETSQMGSAFSRKRVSQCSRLRAISHV